MALFALVVAPMTLCLYCSTQGASIGYTFDKGPNPNWYLYTSPCKLSPGVMTVRTKAIRYGCSMLSAEFRVVPETQFKKLINTGI